MATSALKDFARNASRARALLVATTVIAAAYISFATTQETLAIPVCASHAVEPIKLAARMAPVLSGFNALKALALLFPLVLVLMTTKVFCAVKMQSALFFMYAFLMTTVYLYAHRAEPRIPFAAKIGIVRKVLLVT